jgi:hypothetical protein
MFTAPVWVSTQPSACVMNVYAALPLYSAALRLYDAVFCLSAHDGEQERVGPGGRRSMLAEIEKQTESVGNVPSAVQRVGREERMSRLDLCEGC